MEWHLCIVSNPEILYGKPHIKGTRLAVDLILEKLSLGESFEQIIESYPQITAANILACLAYATAYLRNETIYPIAA